MKHDELRDVRFLLHTNSLSERGDGVTVLALASAMKKFLGISVTIAYMESNPSNSRVKIAEAEERGISTFAYSSKPQLDSFASENGITHSYVYSDGKKQGLAYFDETNPESFRIANTKHFTHVVFRNYTPHGDVYAYISDWLFNWSLPKQWIFSIWNFLYRENNGIRTSVTSFPFFIEEWPLEFESHKFRRSLGISDDAKVVGRIGGAKEFSDPAARRAVKRILLEEQGVHFVMVNTEHFFEHERLHYIGQLTRGQVHDFYQSCDLLINGRRMGESFGYSVVEPLSLGKPVLVPHWIRNPLMDKHHLEVVKGLGLSYLNSHDLSRKIMKVLLDPPQAADLLERVSHFSAQNAMRLLENLITQKM